MYSKSAREKLAAAGAAEGDRVRVEKDGRSFEGVLMPRTEAGDADCLVLKLDSGYNAGIDAAKAKIAKLAAKKTALEKFAARKIAPSKGLKEIALVSTGGTIAARVDYSTGGVKMVLAPEELFAIVPELEGVASIKGISTPFTLASEDLTPREWCKIARETAKQLNAGVDGVVVTHGTDTLGYTAAALSFMLRDLGKPVALVGAQRSPDRASFDGAMNLVCGAHYAKSDHGEVAVVMHATPSDDYCYAHRGTKVRKMHSSRRDAFRSINEKPLAKIWQDGRIEELNAKALRRTGGDVKVEAAFEDKTGFVKAYPGAPAEQLEWFADKKYKGVLVEAYALGHVPTRTLDKKNSWLKAVERCRDEGIVVAFATQCIYGRTNPFVYANLRLMGAQGVTYCGDMLPETAFVKLGWLLAKFGDPDTVRQEMLKNYAGELNERLTEEDFV